MLPKIKVGSYMSRAYSWGLTYIAGENNAYYFCNINNPLRVEFKIPALDNRSLKIDISRSETLKDLYDKISQDWPGLHTR